MWKINIHICTTYFFDVKLSFDKLNVECQMYPLIGIRLK